MGLCCPQVWLCRAGWVPQLSTEKVLALGHGSRAWLGAATPGVETVPHLEGFAAKRAGLQQALPSNL